MKIKLWLRKDTSHETEALLTLCKKLEALQSHRFTGYCNIHYILNHSTISNIIMKSNTKKINGRQI